MPRDVYNLIDEPMGATYRQLLNVSTKFCDTFLLVFRHTIEVSESATRAIEDLKPFLISQAEESEWPGTRLFEQTATVFRFALTQQSIDMIGEIAHSLYSWMQPQLPEDLCLMRFDGEPWLITIAHENDGYFVLSPEEKVALVMSVPELVIAR